MPMLEIAPDSRIRASAGDFGAKVQGDRLLVPRRLGTVLISNHLDTAEDFVSYMQSFPTALAAQLGWTVEDVVRARTRLLEVLRGLLPDEFLDPEPPPPRGYGALRPPGIPVPVPLRAQPARMKHTGHPKGGKKT
jgi:hypothetical protein